MFEFIDKVIYINLEHRKDRKLQIEEVLKVFPEEKVQRFNAIEHSEGAIGCTSSHIAVLEMAIKEGWKNYLVLEDDAMWTNLNNGYSLLEQLVENSFDVVVLSSTRTRYDKYKLISCQTTTAYIVNQSYYQRLLENFKEGLKLLIETKNYDKYAIDRYWQELQKKDNWYVIIPSMLIQRPGYSDIEKRNINYVSYYV